MPIFRTEKEFEDQVYDYIIAYRCNPINGRPVIGVCRQPSLGSYGIADMITLEKHGDRDVVNVIELKNVPFQSGMIFQVSRYLVAVRMACNYEKLNSKFLNLELNSDCLKMYEQSEVIGSLVCTDCADITQGISAAFNMLNITVYSSCLDLLSIAFEQMNLDSDYDPSQIPAIQSSISALSNPIELE